MAMIDAAYHNPAQYTLEPVRTFIAAAPLEPAVFAPVEMPAYELVLGNMPAPDRRLFDYSPFINQSASTRLVFPALPGHARTFPQDAAQKTQAPIDDAAQKTQAPVDDVAQNPAFMKEDCSACENRTYMDGSGDSAVSLQTPRKLGKFAARQTVMSHESEHVRAETMRAKQSGRKLVSQTVQIRHDRCPVCGNSYVAGGTTRTVTANKINTPYMQKAQQKAAGGHC